MSINLVFDLQTTVGWRNNRILYHGKEVFESASLKSGELLISTITADVLHTIVAFENERPMPPDFLPLYFSPGYNQENRRVDADIATSQLLSRCDNLQVVLKMKSLPQAKVSVYVTQTKYEEISGSILSQVVVVGGTVCVDEE